jgi:hypothetical protein
MLDMPLQHRESIVRRSLVQRRAERRRGGQHIGAASLPMPVGTPARGQGCCVLRNRTKSPGLLR